MVKKPMINSVKLYLPNGDAAGEFEVGEDKINKIFFDKENASTLIILTETGIREYHGFIYVALKSYKEKDIQA